MWGDRIYNRLPGCQTTRAYLNVPSYEKYKEVLNKFFNKFEADIETLGDDKDEFYRRQYNGILSIAMKERDNDEIRESYNLVKSMVASVWERELLSGFICTIFGIR